MTLALLFARDAVGAWAWLVLSPLEIVCDAIEAELERRGVEP
jgi:hypothetical protein